MGEVVGSSVISGVGAIVGSNEGSSDGCSVAIKAKFSVEVMDGVADDGFLDGDIVTVKEGDALLGGSEGLDVTVRVGIEVGSSVGGSVGVALGFRVAFEVGILVVFIVGWLEDGSADGA